MSPDIDSYIGDIKKELDDSIERITDFYTDKIDKLIAREFPFNVDDNLKCKSEKDTFVGTYIGVENLHIIFNVYDKDNNLVATKKIYYKDYRDYQFSHFE